MDKKCDGNCTQGCIYKKNESDYIYFIVNQHNKVLPYRFQSYEKAQDQCEAGETVFLAECEEDIYEMFNEEDSR